MKIRTQLIISTIIFGIILLLISASVFITNQRARNIHQQEVLATQIERQAYELGYLVNDYLLHRESQQASRWESKFASFSNDLSKLDVNTPEQEVLLANIKTNQQRLKTVFTEVKTSIESAPQTQGTMFDTKFMRVSWSRLEVQNQGMIFDASRLAQLLREQEDQLRRLTSLLSFVLICVLSAFLLGNYGLAFRRTLNAIAELQAGTRIIGSGDLDFAIAVKREDEIGELSQAFNQMTQQLKTITASRAELEREITERKQAEEALRESRALLLAITDSIPDGIFLKDRQSRIRMANPATLAIIGKPAEQVIGRDDSEHYADPDVGRLIMENDRRIMDSGRTEVVEETGLTPDGYRTYLSTKTPFRDAEGQVIGLLGVAHDITERKQAEEALRRNEALLLETGKLAKVGGWELDLQTMQPVWTLETYHIHEVDPSLQPELESAINFYDPEARPQISEAVRHAIEEGQSYDLELPLITAKGRRIWIRTIGQPEFCDGRCVRLFGVIQDITERKQAEEALLEAAIQKQAFQYARSLIETSLDPLMTISSDGKITDVNEATVNATGVPRQELIGTNFSSYFTEPEKAEQGYRQVFAQGFATNYPLTIRHRDGHLTDVLYNASLYKDAHGRILGAFAAARDVTVQKRAEAELKRHKENLEVLVKERTAELEESSRDLARSNENLEQFAYVASHDLQEPLRVMSSYSQLLERRYKGRLDQDADEFIDFIVEAAARMQKLITDLLAYSRAGRGTTDVVEVDCNKIVRKLVAGMATTIESADGCVTFDRLPVITAHESSLIQLFQNLIGNALKFRSEQPPCVHVSARQAAGEWIFSVRDNGIGIEPQYSQRIFMIFQRLHPRDKYPGTGIGLSICKKIVDTLGGRIWVESEPGQGSTFYFTAPIRKG